jgi:serine protease AprX
LWQQGLQGKGVGIAFVDTGVAPHRDLRDRIVAFQDFVNHRSKPYDDDGHGTHVAGIAAGNGAQSGGRYSGIAPQANIIALKSFDDGGSGKSSNVIAGIQWAIDNRQTYNIRVLNLSIGGKAKLPAHLDPMAMAVEQAVAAGIFVVTAAGNSGPNAQTIETPGIAQSAITVGNLDQNFTTDRRDDTIYGSSSRGPTSPDGFAKPEVCAPGTSITSCDTESGYVVKTGTSMATPMVSGAAALLIGAHPEVSPAQLKQAFMNTAAPLRKEPQSAQGSGMIDPSAAAAKLNQPDKKIA